MGRGGKKEDLAFFNCHIFPTRNRQMFLLDLKKKLLIVLIVSKFINFENNLDYWKTTINSSEIIIYTMICVL